MNLPSKISNVTVKNSQKIPIVINCEIFRAEIHRIKKKVIAKIINEAVKTEICRARKSPIRGSRKIVRNVP